MASIAGWYPDPEGSGRYRYFDGLRWTPHRGPALPPAGWYPDPQGGPSPRYWDGQRWTGPFTAAQGDDHHAVRARADRQHRWVVEGDLRGIYGEHGAELMRPLTEPEREPIGSSARVAEVARTHAELTTLLTDKPPLWPATAFASVMIQRREAVIARLRDVQLGFTDPTGLDLARETTKFMLLIRLQTLVRISEQMGALVATPTFQTMFGESDDEADADVIVLAANRFMDYHDEILQLAEENLGMTASAYDDLYRLQILIGKDLVRLLAAFVDFIDGLIARLAKLEEALRYGSFRVEDDPVIFSFRADDELLQAVKAL